MLHLETATKACAVALSIDGVLLDSMSIQGDGFVHGEQLAPMIERLLSNQALRPQDLGAVSVGAGPGSYTGLRIGWSTAQGLCYGLKAPLISISSLETLIELARKVHPNSKICALIDARRDEVFRRIEDEKGVVLALDGPEIINEHALNFDGNLVLVGDGAQKTSALINCKHILDLDIQMSASGQINSAWKKFHAKDFCDLAYSSPNYTKEFYSPQFVGK